MHSVVSLCNELFPDQGQALSQLWRAKQLEYTWLLSLMGRYEDFWQVTERALTYACKALGLPCESPARARLIEAYLNLEAYPEVPRALRSLSRYTLCILSNGSPRMLKAVVEGAGLTGAFAYIFSADEVRMYKPSPKVYQLVGQKLGVETASIGFVSSNAFDFIGAKSFGLWTVWVNRQNMVLDELGVAPDVNVRQLTGLAAVLQGQVVFAAGLRTPSISQPTPLAPFFRRYVG